VEEEHKNWFSYVHTEQKVKSGYFLKVDGEENKKEKCCAKSDFVANLEAKDKI